MPHRLAALLALTLLAPVSLAGAAPSWREKADPALLAAADRGEEVEFVALLGEQADLSGAERIHGKRAKGLWVFERLREVAARTQPPVLDALARSGAEARPYWIVNMVWARGGAGALAAAGALSGVAHLAANPRVPAALPPVAPDLPAALGIEPGISHVGAPDLWAAGFTGQGTVVAGADTGYDWTHPALRDKYRGWNGSAADHDFNWWDAIHTAGSSCGADSATPCDDNGHGTHTMGTMVGDDGAGNQIGVAPGARWIGCRNMDEGNGTPVTYAECFQFFLAPTDLAGDGADPGLAPDVINNSWGCTVGEGCGDPTILQGATEALRAAGIVVVVSAGNSGTACNTVSTPAAIYDASFTVGALSSATDVIANLSSRGPVTVDGSNRLKPDIAAPGLSVRSSFPGGGYGTSSGTSMASPHVAGLTALLLSLAPCFAGDVDAIEAALAGAAVPRTSGQTCGGILGSTIPNPIYGHGSARAVAPGAVSCALFTDGFESGDTSAWSATSP